MQRRHFEALAEAIREARRLGSITYPEGSPQRDGFESAMAVTQDEIRRAIRRFNPNFDAGRFNEACALDTSYRDKSRGRNSAA